MKKIIAILSLLVFPVVAMDKKKVRMPDSSVLNRIFEQLSLSNLVEYTGIVNSLADKQTSTDEVNDVVSNAIHQYGVHIFKTMPVSTAQPLIVYITNKKDEIMSKLLSQAGDQ